MKSNRMAQVLSNTALEHGGRRARAPRPLRLTAPLPSPLAPLSPQVISNTTDEKSVITYVAHLRKELRDERANERVQARRAAAAAATATTVSPPPPSPPPPPSSADRRTAERARGRGARARGVVQ